MSDGESTRQSMECPTCGGLGAITVDRERRCQHCDEIAVWDYYNPIVERQLDLCDRHLEELNPGVSRQRWVEKGFAQRIEP